MEEINTTLEEKQNLVTEMEEEDFIVLQDNVRDWFDKKNLLGGDPNKQVMKLASEVGELVDAMAKVHLGDIIDAIGDVQVTMVGVDLLANIGYDLRIYVEADSKVTWDKTFILVAELKRAVEADAGKREAYDILAELQGHLIQYAHDYDLDAFECLQSAYDVIKDRTGSVINGTFQKDEK